MFSINILNELIQCVDALLESGFYVVPFCPRDDSRNDVEGPYLFDPAFMSIDVEGDSHILKRDFRGLVVLA